MAEVSIRYSSPLNTWMDCVVFVDEAYALHAERAIRKASELFIKGADVGYTDYIHQCLKEACVPYTLVISDYDVETDEPPQQWYDWVASLNVVKEIHP